MKPKPLVWIGLIVQFIFLLFFLFRAPEPAGAMRVGLERLKSSHPAEAAKIPEVVHGAVPVETSGDFFQMALIGFESLASATIYFVVASMILSILLLWSLRRNKAAHDSHAHQTAVFPT